VSEQYLYLTLYHQRSAELQERAARGRLLAAARDARRAERLTRRAARLAERAERRSQPRFARATV
jgi:Cdc6-like AAA superfamily ATPase